MDRFDYAWALAACLLITLPLELLGRGVYRKPKRLLRALVVPVVVFGLWDLLAVARHQWWFDGHQTLGWWLPGGIPFEEAAFFLVIPVCSILTLEAVRGVARAWRSRTRAQAVDADA